MSRNSRPSDSEQLTWLRAAAVEATADAVLITDRTGIVEWVNPAFSELTGFVPEEVLGRAYPSPAVIAAILGRRAWQGEVAHPRRDGSTVHSRVRLMPVWHENDRTVHFVVVAQEMSTRDPLTGLLNRRGLSESLEKAIRRGQEGSHSTLVLLDLDHFSLVNETVGHEAGDQLLIGAARILSEGCREGDAIARLGNNEFGILMPEIPLAEALIRTEQLRAAVDEYRFRWGEETLSVTASAGAAIVDGSLPADRVLTLASRALHEAKATGKNRVAVRSGTADLGGTAIPLSAAARIKDALTAGRFEIHYQPVTRLSTQEHWYVEALVRMRDEKGTIIPPARFIPIAERLSFMPDIDRFVIRNALETLAAQPGLKMFINLSGLTLSSPDLEGFIRQTLARTGAPASHVCFEVTETVALLDHGQCRERIRRIKQLGCQFALDDFGSGFSSFSYLRSLPVDYIKLDGSYTQGVSASVTCRALAKAVIDVAHVLGKQVIAEQVEERSDAQVLHQLGAEYGQGYLWGHPAPL